MWHAALSDLVWRRRRYAISVLGTALVFAVSLVVTGISDAFAVELDRTFESLGAESFIVPEGVSGPLTGVQPFDPAMLPDDVDPMGYLVQTANPAEPEMVAVMGLPVSASQPALVEGRGLSGPRDAIIGSGSGFGVGSEIEVAGEDFEVVGAAEHLSVNAGMPVIVIPLETFQEKLLGGLPLATAGLTRSSDIDAPDGFRTVNLVEAREDTLRILGDAASTIELVKILLWVVAALIVGSVMFLSAVERSRDFAVFRAIGASTGGIAGGVAMQAALLALAAAVIGEFLAFLLAPIFPMDVVLSTAALVGMPVIAVVIGLVAGVFALRRALGVDPALAFGGGT
jgi:putative ABC transport system permease protein